MHVVYLIQHTETGEIYIGVTSDLKRRIKEHNSGGHKFTTRKSGQWVLVYTEAFRSKTDATRRERKLKSHGTTKYALLKRLTTSLLETKIREGRSESLSGDCLLKT